MRNCINAIGSIGGLILVDRYGHREVCDAAKRQAQRTMDEFVSVAGLHINEYLARKEPLRQSVTPPPA